jgi:AcrR family transcriptional regulator
MREAKNVAREGVSMTPHGRRRSALGARQDRKTTRKKAAKAIDVAEQPKRDIIDAAAAAFMEQGFAATSIDDIARILGSTKGRIYYYYTSKADVFFDIHREAMRLNIETVKPIATGRGNAYQRFRNMIIAQCNLVMGHFALQKVALQGVEMHLSGSTTPEQREILSGLIESRDDFERLFRNVIIEGIETGEFRQMDAKIATRIALGAINWMTVWFKPDRTNGQQNRRKIAREAARIVTRGFLARVDSTDADQ